MMEAVNLCLGGSGLSPQLSNINPQLLRRKKKYIFKLNIFSTAIRIRKVCKKTNRLIVFSFLKNLKDMLESCIKQRTKEKNNRP